MGPDNHLLASLSPADRTALQSRLFPIELERNQLLAQAGEPVVNAVLPRGAVIALVAVMPDGRTVEIRTIGRESGFGLLHSLGSRISFEQVIVQIGGPAYRIPVDVLADLAARSQTLMRAIISHAQATIVLSAQTVACNALHGVQPRLCRWLLLTRDRLGADLLPLTQEHLSKMLGVQRTTVTAAASELQARGWISYSRGKITIRDRKALMGAACECYGVIEGAVDRIFRS